MGKDKEKAIIGRLGRMEKKIDKLIKLDKKTHKQIKRENKKIKLPRI